MRMRISLYYGNEYEAKNVKCQKIHLKNHLLFLKYTFISKSFITKMCFKKMNNVLVEAKMFKCQLKNFRGSFARFVKVFAKDEKSESG